MIKLCYKEYDYKMSLSAMKMFKKSTSEDLSFTLSKLVENWEESLGLGVRQRINSLYCVCDFELGAYLLHSLIKGCNKSISIDEIEDGMFRVGTLPSIRDDNMSDPWPMVLVNVAMDIESDFLEVMTQKKPDIASQ